MKRNIKYFICVALLSIQTVMFSQSFINDTKQWAIAWSIMDLNSYSTNYYKFLGDSTFNGKTYHKLYESTDSSQANWSLYSLWYEMNDSIFQYSTPLNDSLIYDFNLQVGDTFHIDSQLSYKVDSIRYLLWGGSIKKHWFLGGFITWIEGVGKESNFVCSSAWLNSCVYQLLCFHENWNLVYQNPNFTSCYVSTSVPSISNSQELINIYPNPAKETLNITNAEKGIIHIYNVLGEEVLTAKCNEGNNTINVSSLTVGTYILKVVSAKGVVVRKIVKN